MVETLGRIWVPPEKLIERAYTLKLCGQLYRATEKWSSGDVYGYVYYSLPQNVLMLRIMQKLPLSKDRRLLQHNCSMSQMVQIQDSNSCFSEKHTQTIEIWFCDDTRWLL